MSADPRREPPSEFAKALVQGIGMLALIALGAVVLRGLRTGAIVPSEVFTTASAWMATAKAAAPAVAMGAAGVVLAVAAAVLALRHGRQAVRAWLAAWWRYRRRWAAVMASQGLTVTDRQMVRVPRLRAVDSTPGADVLTVTLPRGQSATDWHHRAPSLAEEFGVTTVRVQLPSRRGGKGDIDLLLERGTRALALPAGRPLEGSIPVLLPASARVRALSLSLQILSARLDIPGSIDTYRVITARFRWGVIR